MTTSHCCGSLLNLKQDLQRDVALVLRVGGPIVLAHPPLADEGGHVVVPEAGADVEGHRP